jgi:hypothetical protein
MSRCILALAVLAGVAQADDWPQLQNGPQRQGYSPENIDGPFKEAWAVGFAPERLHPQAQPVIAGGRVFIGTAMGSFHAFDARTGKRVWVFQAGGPILHTAAAAEDRVFFGCMDGNVYALDTADGTLAWKFESGLRTGFSTAALISGGSVFLANRGGMYFAISRKDGKALWRRDLGVPLLMSSALDGGRLYFGAMDQRVYALESETGEIAWRSEPLPGAAFKDYWPVALNGLVFIRPLKVSGAASGPPIEWLHGPLPDPELAKQEKQLETLGKTPAGKNLFVLDQKTGLESFTLPQWVTNTMNGATPPPCVDAEGRLIVPVTLHDWRGGWGRLDLEKRRVTEVLVEEQVLKNGTKRGTGNPDENLNVSAAGRLVFTFHTEEMNAHFTGAWHVDRREWIPVAPRHAETFFSSNTQGGGGNPVAVSGGMIFHTSWNTLNARIASPAK